MPPPSCSLRVSQHTRPPAPTTTTPTIHEQIESEARWDAIASTAVCRRWWAHMAPLMETDADGRPVAEPLQEVFYLA